jgi:glycolate oxidase
MCRAQPPPHGLYYAPDPSSQLICTIGGNVAFNSGGAHCLKYGMTANHVLGLKAVLPDGEVVQLGGEPGGVGPDWPASFVGSEGLFGVALEITLRLLPRPENSIAPCSRRTLAGRGRRCGGASRGIGLAARRDGDHGRAGVSRPRRPPSTPATRAMPPRLLIVELEGERIQVEAEFAHLLQVIEAPAPKVRRAKDDADRARIWKGRKSAFSAVGRLSPDYIVQDGVVPRSRLGEALADDRAAQRVHKLRVANVFHAGDGNLHPLILVQRARAGRTGARRNPGRRNHARICIDLGGSITGEHGVGMEKRRTCLPCSRRPTCR